MCEAKNSIQLHLHRTQQEIFDIERNIDLIRKAIQNKANPLRVAQTRLEARGHRAGIEQCKYDFIRFLFRNFIYKSINNNNYIHLFSTFKQTKQNKTKPSQRLCICSTSSGDW